MGGGTRFAGRCPTLPSIDSGLFWSSRSGLPVPASRLLRPCIRSTRQSGDRPIPGRGWSERPIPERSALIGPRLLPTKFLTIETGAPTRAATASTMSLGVRTLSAGGRFRRSRSWRCLRSSSEYRRALSNSWLAIAFSICRRSAGFVSGFRPAREARSHFRSLTRAAASSSRSMARSGRWRCLRNQREAETAAATASSVITTS